MLSFKDLSDYCDLSDDEIAAILNGANESPIEVCAMVQQIGEQPQECRRLLRYLQDYLEKTEQDCDARRAHELHQAIEHFVSNHHYV